MSGSIILPQLIVTGAESNNDFFLIVLDLLHFTITMATQLGYRNLIYIKHFCTSLVTSVTSYYNISEDYPFWLVQRCLEFLLLKKHS
jgi:hypothetical protein